LAEEEQVQTPIVLQLETANQIQAAVAAVVFITTMGVAEMVVPEL
jgi:HKD family nuclease